MRSRITVARARVTVAAAIVLIAGSGCYFLKYDKLARTHVGVLVAMTEKIEDITHRDGTPPAALGEYRYPLERAQDFARIAARRFEGRASLQSFRDLCAAYDGMLTTAERMRVGGTDAERAFADAAAAVRTAAARVEDTLDRERAGSTAASAPPAPVSTL